MQMTASSLPDLIILISESGLIMLPLGVNKPQIFVRYMCVFVVPVRLAVLVVVVVGRCINDTANDI